MNNTDPNMLPVTMDNNSYINNQPLLQSNNSVSPYLSLNAVYYFKFIVELNASNAK